MATIREFSSNDLEQMAGTVEAEKDVAAAPVSDPANLETDQADVIGMGMDTIQRHDDLREETATADYVANNKNEVTTLEASTTKTLEPIEKESAAAGADKKVSSTPVFEEREKPSRGNKKIWAILGAGLVTLTLLGGGIAIGRASSTPREAAVAQVPEDLAPNTTTAPTSSPEISVSVPTSEVENSGTSTPETTTAPPDTQAPGGEFEPGSVIKGEPTIEGKMPNGDTIKVAELASIGEGPDRVASTFMGLVQAWANTKDQKFLDAISTDPGVQDEITSVITDMEGDALRMSGFSNLDKGYTVSVFKNPEDSPKFADTEYDKDSVIISLVSGDVRLNPYVDVNAKDHPMNDPVTEGLDYTLSYHLDQSEFTLQVGRSPKTGKSQIEDLGWRWETRH